MEVIKGVIRDYAWGDPRAIAEILGHEPPGHPEAEYWLGAHPSAPSEVTDDDRTLDAVVAADPDAALGPDVAGQFEGLPYLLKILAAGGPLSIQAHPSLDQAKTGFAAEEAAGLDRSAPNRNYRDDNHKPELICALTPFEAKCGFRTVAESRRLLLELDDDRLVPLLARLGAEGAEAEVLADAVAWLLRLPADAATELAEAATAAAAARRDQPGDFQVEYQWTGRIAQSFPGDIGIVIALLLNHVSLQPGQAIFLEAGNLHSYLHGVGVELMANSDNVLRGGLTGKHIDVDQLLGVVDYRPAAAPVQSPDGSVHRFEIPVPEFGLTRLDSSEQELGRPGFDPVGPEIILVTSGAISVQTAARTLELARGDAAFIGFGDGHYDVADLAPGTTTAWRATVGDRSPA